MHAPRQDVATFERQWRDCPHLTPRQAYALAATLDIWADLHIAGWLEGRGEPLHSVPPFDDFDLRVMMQVAENRAWAEGVRRRCHKVSDEIKQGTLPFDRSGPYIDEVLIGAALESAQAYLDDVPDAFEGLSVRDATGLDGSGDDEEHLVCDADWDIVSDDFDDRSCWGEWEVPLYTNHPLLPLILAERHPYTWFDVPEAADPDELKVLADLFPGG